MKVTNLPATRPEPVSVHLIGISGYARAVLRSLLQVIEPAGGRLVAATVINRGEEEEACRALESRGCRIFSDYREMLEATEPSTRNLCIIPTSIFQHAPMTVAAIRAGHHVLVEKPLAGSVEECQQMIREAAIHGRAISVGFQDMYATQVLQIRKALDDGIIGQMRAIRIVASWPRDRSYYTRNRWAGKENCDGRPVFDSPLCNAFAHFINLALYFAGREPGRMALVSSVRGRLLRFFPIETFDTARVSFNTQEGIEISCVLTHAALERVEPQIEIVCDHGTLHWRQEDHARITDLRGESLIEWALDSEESNRSRMLSQVIRDTHGGHAPRCSAAMAMHHVEAFRLAARELPVEDGPTALAIERLASASQWSGIPELLDRLLEAEFAASR
ncbi:MAG: hypothetical protein BGO12_16250 [Verrucomicrobia bacterium 61-8]|nr:Gfo/Idh/MocA family oxidoreductase [Verrucomicrobiota bacterium]OJU98795.1 MAG: hypothetical protein BGO12_16250 [Verrucomicrobia bacterium 61-8]